MNQLSTDIRIALRALRRKPGFSLLVVLTLALGIGGTTAIFGFVQGVLLQRLPYPDPGELVLVCETHPDRPADWCGGAPGNLRDWQRESRSLEKIGLGRTWMFGLKNSDGKFESVAGGVATSDLFDVFRVRPQLGRLFSSSDSRQGQDQVAIIGFELWQRRFGGDPGVLGQTVNLDEEIYTVVGVLPRGFEVPLLESVELWIPLWSERVDWRSWRGLRPYARLAAGHTLQQAQNEMGALAERLAEEYPDSNAGWGASVHGLHDWMVASVRPALWIFLGAVGFVFLIACANVANLLLTRATVREREFAIRSALGAGAVRLIRFLLIESLLLTALASGAGLLLGFWTIRLFVAIAPQGFPRLEEVGLDGGVFAFVFVLALGTTVLFGLVPAWQSSRLDLTAALKGGQQEGSPRSTRRVRGVLVVVEVALATVLLAGGGLLIRSFVNLTRWEPGFDTQNLVVFQVFPPMGRYQDAPSLGALYRTVNEELTALPGVLSVGEVSAGPLFGGGDGAQELQVEGRPLPGEGGLPVAAWYDAGTHYFSTLGIPLKRGRYFTDADREGSPLVAIINETMAERLWPDQDPIGERITMQMHEATFEIVGVVADIPPFDPREALEPMVYWPLQQLMRGATYYVARTDGEPAGVIPSMRARLQEIEPEMTVAHLATLDEQIARQLIRPRFQMLLLVIFSVIAFTIAAVGIYGVISYSVAQRTREFGIRMALGARHGDVQRLVLRSGVSLAGAGVATGLLGAAALTRLLGSMLVEVTPTDPVTFTSLSAGLMAVALIAAWVPASRAARVDPMATLRDE